MRVLNDEEIRNALNAMLSVPDSELPTAYEVIARAQFQSDIKGFVEWFDEIYRREYRMVSNSHSDSNCNELLRKIRQELKKIAGV
ncbi:hypothetical protein LCGC14_2717760 [marine sediment metagenome]|uniref:Uncharacterized protein n=1 Tax=marine sediment metagenome TaxID=412755 RepID=A0A0F9BK38_9ZZZZ